jgi:hypothetical protein
MKSFLKIGILCFTLGLKSVSAQFSLVSGWYQNVGSAIRDFDRNYILLEGKPNVDSGSCIIKLDSAANVILNFVFSKNCGLSKICQTTDSGYVAAGFDSTLKIVKLNRNGIIQWSKSYDTTRYVIVTSLFQARDQGLLLCGYINSFPVIPTKMFVIKTDSAGNLLWGRTLISGSRYNEIYGAEELPDSSIVLTGMSGTSSAFQFDVIKLSSHGDLVWCKSYSSINFGSIYDIETDGYDIYLLESSSLYAGILKIDSSGSVQWFREGHLLCGSKLHRLSNKQFVAICTDDEFFIADSSVHTATAFRANTTSQQLSFNDIIQAGNGGFMLIANDYKYSIFTTDSAFNSPGCIIPKGVITMTDDSVTVQNEIFTVDTFGVTQNESVTISNYSESFDPGCITTLVSEENEHLFNVYPNPSRGEFTIQLYSPFDRLMVYNSIGQIIVDQKTDISLIRMNLDKGLYFLEIQSVNKTVCEKIIVN